MKKIVMIIIIIIFLFLNDNAQEILVLKDSINLGKMMEDNDVFIKHNSDFDIYKGSIYFNDVQLGRILQVDLKTGKLVRQISSRGQGPGELMWPERIIVKNNKIFVTDKGFGGIKIFDFNGKLIIEFKFRSPRISFKDFDVNDKDEIFFPDTNPKTNTLVTVYNIKGKLLSSIIKKKLNPKKDMNPLSKLLHYNLRLDNKGNIYLLFELLREIHKYDKNGSQIWVKKISNKFLDKFPHNDGSRINIRGGITTTSKIHDFEITEKNNIVIIHAGGGCILNENGNLSKLLRNEDPDFKEIEHGTLYSISIHNNLLINRLFFATEYLRIYKFKEE